MRRSRYLRTLLEREIASCLWCSTFSIITKAHLGLSKTNCVLPLTNAIEFLKLGLVDTLLYQSGQNTFAPILKQRCTPEGLGIAYLAGEIDFDGLDANILRAGRHRWRR